MIHSRKQNDKLIQKLLYLLVWHDLYELGKDIDVTQ